MTTLRCGDCLEEMRKIPDGSVDFFCTDLPYGITCCKWDTPVPFEPLWAEVNRVCKRNAAMALFASQPFATDLINSNRKNFRYEWVWMKNKFTGVLNANKMPLKNVEYILMFYRRLPTYNPQMETSDRRTGIKGRRVSSEVYRRTNFDTFYKEGQRFPIQTLGIPAVLNHSKEKAGHPTQKPVALLEYLVKTYTNAGDTVLDCCMGSGTCGVACANTGRNFIGVEIERKFFEIAKSRIEQAER